MLNNPKTMAQGMASNQLAAAFRQAAGNVWSANANILRVSRVEGSKVFVALVLTADAIAARNVKAWLNRVEGANDKVSESWQAATSIFDTRVAPLLDRFGMAAPAKFGIEMLGKGLANVSEQVAALTRSGNPARRIAVARKAQQKG